MFGRQTRGFDAKSVSRANRFVNIAQVLDGKRGGGIVQHQRVRRRDQGDAFETSNAANTRTKQVWLQHHLVVGDFNCIGIGDDAISSRRGEQGQKAVAASAGDNNAKGRRLVWV